MKAVAKSPAKVILFGEHFVVGGNTAISMAVELPTFVTAGEQETKEIQIFSDGLGVEAVFSFSGQLLRYSKPNAESALRPIFEAANFTLKKLNSPGVGLSLEVKSDVPIGMGLGSSAATAVSTVSAISALLRQAMSKEGIFEAAYSLERIVHGSPSGIDQATVTYGGLISYRKGKVESRLTLSKPPQLLIGNTGLRRSTGEYVGRVTKLRENDPEQYTKIALEAERISEEAAKALRDYDEERLGVLMNENQRLLELLGVSSPELEKLISAARSAGALGAKLTGGGGGGCMIALVNENIRNEVSTSVGEAGGHVLPGTFSPIGVQATVEEG